MAKYHPWRVDTLRTTTKTTKTMASIQKYSSTKISQVISSRLRNARPFVRSFAKKEVKREGSLLYSRFFSKRIHICVHISMQFSSTEKRGDVGRIYSLVHFDARPHRDSIREQCTTDYNLFSILIVLLISRPMIIRDRYILAIDFL